MEPQPTPALVKLRNFLFIVLVIFFAVVVVLMITGCGSPQ